MIHDQEEVADQSPTDDRGEAESMESGDELTGSGADPDVAGGPPETTPPDDGESAESGDEIEPLPKDVQYDILKNRRRRLVLTYLFEEENPAALGTLSEYIAGIENEKDPRQLDSQERKRAYVGLYQCHLPRMDDAGVVEFNKNRGVVEQGPHAEELLPHLDQDGAPDLTWPRVYLLCSMFGFGGFLITQSPLLGVGWLGPPVLALTLLAVAAISAFRLWDHHSDDD